ncbi:MAG: xanthine dehydrogenase family protein [Deltaproteobacteria bacterium]|nr:xanthine dehydrogenase family protein [Deltaproteobacteria bacterium]
MSFSVVGTAARRVDGIEKVTGRAKFTADLEIPGVLEGKVLRSPYPHARIRAVDASKAEALPGVVAVLTRDDVHGYNPYYGHCLRDRPVIALDRVRFVGEPVAAVAAESALAAEEALSLIRVQYEELPAATTVDEALAPGAPILHEMTSGTGDFHEIGLSAEAQRNICHHEHLEHGNVEEGFAQADEIIEDTFEFPMVFHFTMEPHTIAAQFDDDGITLWAACQHPFLVRSELAQMFNLPQSMVRVIVPYVGGGFGGRSYIKLEPLVVALARKARRPVRVVQTAAESMLTARRHSARCWIKTGVKRDGTLVAKQVELYLDSGAFADNGPRVAARAATRVRGPYRLPHVRIDVYAVYTNTVPAGSFRSIGGPQSVWPSESQMDMIAERLGLDPLEFRLKNLVHRGEEVKPGAKPMDADLAMGLRKVASMLGWGRQAPSRTRALGLAVGVTDSEAMPVSTAIVRLLADGSVVLMAGSTEMGQGSRTVLSQIVAEELGLPLNRVMMRATDTAVTPFDRSTGASRSTTVMGTAVQAAAQDVRRQLLEIGAEAFGAPTDEIVLRDGALVWRDKRLELGKAVARFFGIPGGEIIGRGYARPGHGGLQLPVFWEVGMGGADVEVDPETGEVRLRRYVTLADVGKAINPAQCEGQDEGAAMMGIGHTFFESLLYEKGQPLNPNLVDYRVPTFADLPDEFESALIENQDGPGPYGVKGMGEAGVLSVAPAVASAIARSTGVRIKQLPLTPERVWRALRGQAKKG